MIYSFVKKDGDVKAVGNLDMGLLDQDLNVFLSASWEMSDIAEYVSQVLKGSEVKVSPELTSEPVVSEVPMPSSEAAPVAEEPAPSV